MNQLIRCKNCDELFMRTPFDQYPEYELNAARSPEHFQSTACDDFNNFLIQHQGHRLENLKIIEGSIISEKAYSEPMKTSFFKATNGKVNFVIKKFRERIDEPLKYQIFNGDYALKCIGIEIQSQAISKQLKREWKSPLAQTQIDTFVQLYQTIADGIDLKNLERVSEESQHPLEVYYKIDDLHLMTLLRNCHRIFKGKDYSEIEAFIHRHRDDGVLLLKGTYQIQLIEVSQKIKRTMLPSMPIKKEKRVEKK